MLARLGEKSQAGRLRDNSLVDSAAQELGEKFTIMVDSTSQCCRVDPPSWLEVSGARAWCANPVGTPASRGGCQTRTKGVVLFSMPDARNWGLIRLGVWLGTRGDRRPVALAVCGLACFTSRASVAI